MKMATRRAAINAGASHSGSIGTPPNTPRASDTK